MEGRKNNKIQDTTNLTTDICYMYSTTVDTFEFPDLCLLITVLVVGHLRQQVPNENPGYYY